MAANTHISIFKELADFLISPASLEKLAAYKVSSGVQHHIDSLLDKNREGTLSTEERIELEKILAVSHVITLTKTKAQLNLSYKS